jgi:hypothetical protein
MISKMLLKYVVAFLEMYYVFSMNFTAPGGFHLSVLLLLDCLGSQ